MLDTLPKRFDGSIGVFAGSGMNTYLIHNLLANRRLLESAGLFQLKQTGNDKDVLATRVSYQLDLRGPSINVQTACSTSLVAIHLACQSLLNFECDMALGRRSYHRNPAWARLYLSRRRDSFPRRSLPEPSMQVRAERSLEAAWELSCCDGLKTRLRIATISAPSFSDRQSIMMARARWVIWRRALKARPR